MVDEVRDGPLFVSYKPAPAIKFFCKQYAFGLVTGKQFVALSCRFTDQVLSLASNRDHQIGAKLKPVLPEVFVVDAGPDFFREARVARGAMLVEIMLEPVHQNDSQPHSR